MAITNINPVSVLYDSEHGWLSPGFMVPTTVTEFTFHDTVLEKDYKYTLTNGVWSLEEYVDAIDPAEFVLVVKTDNVGTSADDEFNLRLTGENYEYKAGGNDWVAVESSVYNQATPVLAKFPSAGEHELRVRNIGGSAQRLQIYDGGDELKLREVRQWGSTVWTYLSSAFRDCVFEITATDAPILNITNSAGLGSMFRDATLTSVSNDAFLNWDVSGIRTFILMFYLMGGNCNPAVQDWETPGTNMVNPYRLMFGGVGSFNRDISGLAINSGMTDISGIVNGTSMSTVNYSRLLISWANQVYANSGPYSVDATSQNGCTYDDTEHTDLGTPYTDAVAARAYLVGATALWTIDGDSLAT